MDGRNGLRQLQTVELEIMKRFAQICDEHHLRFFLLGGTFLGAVRHKGFIPWDDDIDVGMPRDDYERFIELTDKELKNPYVFKSFTKGNEDTIYFSRIEDLSHPVIDDSAQIRRQRYAWIDVFPLDGMPDNPVLRFIHKTVLLYRRVALQYSNYSIVVNQDLPNRPFHEKVLIDIGKLIRPERFFDTQACLKKLDKTLKKYRYEDCEYVVNFMGAYKFKEMFPRRIYKETALYDFEDAAYPAPKDYDFVLSQMYGDYMTPPKDADKYKHHIIVKTEEDRK